MIILVRQEGERKGMRAVVQVNVSEYTCEAGGREKGHKGCSAS